MQYCRYFTTVESFSRGAGGIDDSVLPDICCLIRIFSARGLIKVHKHAEYKTRVKSGIEVPTLVLPGLFNRLLDPPNVLLGIFTIEGGCLGVGRTGWVGVMQERLDRGQNGRDVVGRAPAVLEDVQT